MKKSTKQTVKEQLDLDHHSKLPGPDENHPKILFELSLQFVHAMTKCFK